ncbi:hypothetical protein MDA_GLEAN10020514 [Myotis davidii]|uniref:Uncharacterized protein n=1 Tax=Myotis davidii TaxID=225400 RepID=L5LDD2_MYODS|nr:hypothetical protein MDA_GLEAN10020514 [Myotis davidii]
MQKLPCCALAIYKDTALRTWRQQSNTWLPPSGTQTPPPCQSDSHQTTVNAAETPWRKMRPTAQPSPEMVAVAARIHTNFLIILLKGSHVLTGLIKLSFLHALTYLPVDKGTLGNHQVKPVVQVSPGLSNSYGVAQHAHRLLYFGQVSTRYHSGRLVINANFEASGAPVHKLDSTPGLDGGNGSIDIFGDHVTMVQQTTSHVFTMARVTFHHLVAWLKALIGDFCYRKLFMVGFLSRDDRGICGQREVDAGIGHQGSHVLTGLIKLSFLHALTYLPVDKGTLGNHQVKPVVQVSPGLSNSYGVAQHAHRLLYFGHVSTRYHSGRLVINANFEASGAPVHKLDSTPGLDGGNGSIDIFGDHVTMVQQTTSHVFTMARVTFHHLVAWLKALIGDFCYRKLFMVGFLSRDDRGICGQREVDAGIGHQGGVGGEDGVVGLNYNCGDLGGWINGELQLGLLAIIDRETFHQQRGKPKTSSPTKAVENQEALKGCALVSQFPNSMQDEVNDLLASGVVSTGIVIGSIFLACNQQLRVESWR